MTTTSPTNKGKLKATTYYSDENPTGTTTQEEWPEQESEEERTGLLENHQQKPSTKHRKNSRRRNSNKPIITPSIERESLIERIRRLGTQTYTGKSRTIAFNPPGACQRS
jgi:hypothetical protein